MDFEKVAAFRFFRFFILLILAFALIAFPALGVFPAITSSVDLQSIGIFAICVVIFFLAAKTIAGDIWRVEIEPDGISVTHLFGNVETLGTVMEMEAIPLGGTSAFIFDNLRLRCKNGTAGLKIDEFQYHEKLIAELEKSVPIKGKEELEI